MDINQRNVFGDNIVNVGKADRVATPELADEVARLLRHGGASSVAIHYEYDGETAEFVEQLAVLLGERLPVVNIVPHGMSGYRRDSLIVEAARDGATGYLRIGTR